MVALITDQRIGSSQILGVLARVAPPHPNSTPAVPLNSIQITEWLVKGVSEDDLQD